MTRTRVFVLVAMALAGIAASSASRAGDPVTLRSADVLPADSPSVQAVSHLGTLIRERTGGRLRVEVMADNKQSGSYKLSQVRNGALDMARVNLALLNTSVPPTAVLSLPFLFKSRQQMREVLDGPIGAEILASMEPQGLIGLCFYDAGAHSYYGKRPIRSAADLKGLAIEVPAAEFSAAVVRALGAEPVPMPYYRARAALQTGVVAAADNTWSAYVADRHYEIAPYFSLTEHSRTPSVLVFSKKVWDGLSPADQRIIRDATQDSVGFLRDKLDAFEIAARHTAEAAGAQVIENIDRKSFADILAPLEQKLLPDANQQRLVGRIRAPALAVESGAEKQDEHKPEAGALHLPK
jgi:tripartite ATP-independent transporter DctP family solute receptor